MKDSDMMSKMKAALKEVIMKRIALIACIVTAQISGFSSEIAGNVSPNPNPPPAMTPDSDDDVIIMEEDSDYEENEEEDAHDKASEFEHPPGEDDTPGP